MALIVRCTVGIVFYHPTSSIRGTLQAPWPNHTAGRSHERGDTTIQLWEWSRLEFYDREPVLRVLRPRQEALAQSHLDPQIRSLRTDGLKTEREHWEAAVFAYGMGVAVVGVNVLFASPVEHSDYDFVTSWEVDASLLSGSPQGIGAIQLNPAIGLLDFLSGVKRYPTSQRTVVAIHLNRDVGLDLTQLSSFQLVNRQPPGQYRGVSAPA